MKPNVNPRSRYRVLPQMLAGLSASLGGAIIGGWVAFPSVAVPKLYREEGSMKVDQFEGSWIVGLFFIGGGVGGFSGAIFNQYFGPKKAFLLIAPLGICIWICTAVAHRLWVIYIVRILSGLLFGVYQANGKVYNAEISHPEWRGTIGTFIGIMFCLGQLYTYLVGYLSTSWRVLAWLELPLACIFFICVCFIPTSPYWLVEKGRDDEAREALVWLRGSDYCVNEELQEIIGKKKEKDKHQVKPSIASVIMSMAFLRPFLRLGTLMIICQWSGMQVVTSYMVEIFKTSGSSVDPTLAPIIVISIQLGLASLSAIVLRVAPRKPLFLFSTLVIAVGQMTIGTYSYLTHDTHTSEIVNPTAVAGSAPYGWVPLVCVILVCSCQVTGVVVVIQILLAESFPTEIRSYASGICGAATAVNTFGSTKLFPSLKSLLGFHGTFWFYGAVMFFGTVFGAISIPENRGQSLVKTEDKFQNKEGGSDQTLGGVNVNRKL